MLDVIPPAALVLVAALLVAVLPRKLGHGVGALATGTALALSWLVPAGAHLQVELFGAFQAVLYNVDSFSRLMGLIFSFIGLVAVVYSYASDAERTQTAYALSYVGTSLAAVFAGDWLTLVFFWELMAVTSTLLVWHYGGRAVRAGFRYAILHGIGGSLVLAALVWHYAEAGTFLFGSLPGVAVEPGIAGTVAPVLIAIGIGVNVGFVGLHAWLPDTYPRPHIAASVFLCVYTTKTGVYGMYRAFPDGHLWIAYMGGAMAVFGATMALLQSDMRRLLSYHIQSQVGYMIAGVGIGTKLATAGAFGHVFNHILYKSLLFMTVGVVIYRTGEESLKKIGGLAKDMPITAGAFVVAALSISGFPLFNGYVSKGMITYAAHHGYEPLFYLLMIGGVGTFLSFIKLGYHAFFHGSYDGNVLDANRGQSVAMVAVAALCVFFGVVPSALYDLLPEGTYAAGHYTAYTVSHVLEVAVLAVTAVIGFVLLKNALEKVGKVPDIDAIYNPLTFYGTRAVVVGVTELYAAVDRAVVGFVGFVTGVAADPEAAVAATPLGDRVDDEYAHPLRAGVGTSILLVTLVVTLVLLVVLG
ncbi:multisubunit sodium/proton antiporter, MrpD subunit [Natronoarchaeum philippinense]|uniref:Multisubunit sodium/proton antiporter, MrpD subunit n=1 Tax=Natronoarchaeum philippinense TaxID=558529 RepID=A0A285MZK5_NATPI|nr:Na(+)/H(+) antiporter subunit D [Natronoarchaeum philippinense]SNZ02630.1 multisubunit sodium/proton antiporter, MrpD subunit [Natronoarchaeum philippinense]